MVLVGHQNAVWKKLQFSRVGHLKIEEALSDFDRIRKKMTGDEAVWFVDLWLTHQELQDLDFELQKWEKKK